MEGNIIDIVLLHEYNIASEYHQAAFCTYGTNSKYERKYKHKLSKVKRKIRLVDSNFVFEPTKEVISLNYSLFGQNIDELILKEYDLLTPEEFNFVSHACSGGMFILDGITDIELKELKNCYLLIHESDYVTSKRIRVINDIIND